jgi:hypothetical protein
MNANPGQVVLANTHYDVARTNLIELSKLLRDTDADVCRRRQIFPLIGYRPSINLPIYTDLTFVIYKSLCHIRTVCYCFDNAIEYIDIEPLRRSFDTLVNILNSVIMEYLNYIDAGVPVVCRALTGVHIIYTDTDVSATIFTKGLFYVNNLFTANGDPNILLITNGRPIRLNSIALTHENIKTLLTPIRHFTNIPIQVRINTNVRQLPSLCISDLKILPIKNEPIPNAKEETTCPICFDTTTADQMVYTNCSHGFCLDCMVTYTNSIKAKTCKPNCPYCRTQIVEIKTHDEDIFSQFSNHIATM